SAQSQGPKFLADDPIDAMPPPLPVGKPAHTRINDFADFFAQSKEQEPPPPVPARAVNTLGEVPDSEWFTNRQASHAMNRDELQRGAATPAMPAPPFTVTGGKTEGITPGFRMKDSEGRNYFVKSDPMNYPELATAADVIVSKFLYAIGYNT